jgi:hypothetical protein
MDRVTHLRDELKSHDAGRVLRALRELAELGLAAEPALNDLVMVGRSTLGPGIAGRIREAACAIDPRWVDRVDYFVDVGINARLGRKAVTKVASPDPLQAIDTYLQQMHQFSATGHTDAYKTYLKWALELHPTAVERVAVALRKIPPDPATRAAILEVIDNCDPPPAEFLQFAVDTIFDANGDFEDDDVAVRLIGTLAAVSPDRVMPQLATAAATRPDLAWRLAQVLEYSEPLEKPPPAAIEAMYGRALRILYDDRPAARVFAAAVLCSHRWLRQVDPALIRAARACLTQASGDACEEVREYAGWAPREMGRILGERDPRHNADHTA